MSATFKVRVYDNFHYQDEDAVWDGGTFGTFGEALAVARGIVDDSLREQKPQARSATQLLERYKMFGDDPIIVGRGDERFSAWNYAESRAEAIFVEGRRVGPDIG